MQSYNCLAKVWGWHRYIWSNKREGTLHDDIWRNDPSLLSDKPSSHIDQAIYWQIGSGNIGHHYNQDIYGVYRLATLYPNVPILIDLENTSQSLYKPGDSLTTKGLRWGEVVSGILLHSLPNPKLFFEWNTIYSIGCFYHAPRDYFFETDLAMFGKSCASEIRDTIQAAIVRQPSNKITILQRIKPGRQILNLDQGFAILRQHHRNIHVISDPDVTNLEQILSSSTLLASRGAALTDGFLMPRNSQVFCLGHAPGWFENIRPLFADLEIDYQLVACRNVEATRYEWTHDANNSDFYVPWEQVCRLIKS